MEINQSKMERNPSEKADRTFILTQALLRSMTFAASFVSFVLMATSRQLTAVYGFAIVAKYTDSPPFVFLVGGNAVASCYSLISFAPVFLLISKSSNPSRFSLVFLFDLVMMSLVVAATSAATAFAYLGKNGNSHTHWDPVCGYVPKFCNRVQTSLIFSYASSLLFFLLVILAANRLRPVVSN